MFAKEIYQNRRARLVEQMDKGILLFLGNSEAPLNYVSNCYKFRQDSSFLYFFGLQDPDFAAIIDHTVELRDRLYPEAVISVLSNASNLHKPAVCEALKKVNNPILKVDGCTKSFVNDINKPAPGYSLERTLNNLESFHGDFILQTMFLKGEIDGRPLDSTEASEVAGWQAIVRRLRPREIMMYTIDRETPMSGLRKVTIEEMEAIAAPLREEGFQIQIRG